MQGQVLLACLKQAQRAGERGERCFHLMADCRDKLVLGAFKLALLAHVSHDTKKAQMLAAIGLDLGG